MSADVRKEDISIVIETIYTHIYSQVLLYPAVDTQMSPIGERETCATFPRTMYNCTTTADYSLFLKFKTYISSLIYVV